MQIKTTALRSTSWLGLGELCSSPFFIALGAGLAVTCETKWLPTLWPSFSILRYLLKRNENTMCLQKKTGMRVFTAAPLVLAGKQESATEGWTDRQQTIHATEHSPAGERNSSVDKKARQKRTSRTTPRTPRWPDIGVYSGKHAWVGALGRRVGLSAEGNREPAEVTVVFQILMAILLEQAHPFVKTHQIV